MSTVSLETTLQKYELFSNQPKINKRSSSKGAPLSAK